VQVLSFAHTQLQLWQSVEQQEVSQEVLQYWQPIQQIGAQVVPHGTHVEGLQVGAKQFTQLLEDPQNGFCPEQEP